ncbi:MAG: DUF3108 domain-containing protein [Planctomycetota bacterium]|mgnify:CR=1 FL=1
MFRPLADLAVLALLLVLAAPGLDSVAPEILRPSANLAPASAVQAPSTPDLLPAPAGEPFERLTYRARAWKGVGLVGLDVGTATFEIFSEPGPGPARVRILAKADGSALGYSIKAVIESLADASTLAPVRYRYVQEGSGARRRGFDFGANAVAYWKSRHCRNAACANPAHSLASAPGRPPLHCPDHDCERPDHQVWQMRRTRDLDAPAFDVLAAIYRARDVDLGAATPPSFRLLVDKDGDWDVTLKARGTREIQVPAGTFSCRQIRLETKRHAPKPDETEAFEGPFGLKGNISLWVDEETKIPVRISGTVPFGVDFNAEVNLEKREGAYAPPRSEGR